MSKRISKFANAISLQEFVRRQQIVTMYRKMLVQARRIPDSNVSQGITQQIKDDFRNNKTVKDPVAVKSLIVEGARSLKQIEAMSKDGSQSSGSAGSSGSWLDSSEEGDTKGRVGSGWPWAN